MFPLESSPQPAGSVFSWGLNGIYREKAACSIKQTEKRENKGWYQNNPVYGKIDGTFLLSIGYASLSAQTYVLSFTHFTVIYMFSLSHTWDNVHINLTKYITKVQSFLYMFMWKCYILNLWAPSMLGSFRCLTSTLWMKVNWTLSRFAPSMVCNTKKMKLYVLSGKLHIRGEE